MKINCFYCGKECHRKPSHIRKSKHIFCSKNCFNLWKHFNYGQIFRKGEIVCCNFCGEKFYKSRATIKATMHNFCSKECYKAWRKITYIKSGFKGKHFTDESKRKISEAMYGTVAWNRGMHPRDWLKTISYEEWLAKIFEASKKKPTKLEQRFITIMREYNLPFDYVGDGKIFIAGKVPDFINCNGKKQLIEVFGNYWHKPEDEEHRKEHFAKYGFDTLVFWESDIKAMSDLQIVQKIGVWT